MKKGRKWHKKRVKGHHAFYLFANFSIGTSMIIHNNKKVNNNPIEVDIREYEETNNINYHGSLIICRLIWYVKIHIIFFDISLNNNFPIDII